MTSYRNRSLLIRAILAKLFVQKTVYNKMVFLALNQVLD
jgi:hypothetical protein